MSFAALLLLLQGAPEKPASGWETEWRARAELAYDTNVWLLEDDQQDRLEEERPGDEVSGRYDDMESVDDFILTPGLRFLAKGPGPLGTLSLELAAQYFVHLENAARNYLELDAGVGTAIGSRGSLALALEVVPEFFRKNYLADATDFSGNVNAFERIYEDGTYRQWEVVLEYRHRLVDPTEAQPWGWTASAGLSYRDRSYDSPFSYRDEEAPGIRLGVDVERRPVKAGIRYTYEAIDSPTESVVMLRDEVAFGTVLNSDGLIDDQDARTVQAVDRTRHEHEFGFFVRVDLTSRLEAEFVYERLLRDFQSDEPFDLEHNGRDDIRDQIRLALTYKITKGWAARAGYEGRWQTSDQDDPDAGDDGDYERALFFLSLSYRW